ncbi:decaprenylphospho-beta-D-erythro-pentofuranosid-2-ulose 2-reductase, partial [Streptomyces sp. SID11385]|nr:decaprenylphospho-beta-D-erythro-pentofuranosid-2-ulose 2-reductase [Streptomyces sp. SID11385]
MQDPIGPPRSLLLLGGTSELGLATARRMIGRRTRTVWLAGRAGPALDAAA